MKPPRTETVRGAVLGLAAGTVDGGGRGLVPAWFFEVAGKDGGPARTVAEPASARETAAPSAGATRTVPGFSYKEADRTLTVNFWGGVCSTYAVEAREEGTDVLVKITDTPNKPGQACIMLAKEMSQTVTLNKPLGDRKVGRRHDGQAAAAPVASRACRGTREGPDSRSRPGPHA
ncbi:hypothetical protein ACFSNO_15125 [Streptomyces cirratus]